MEYSEFWLGSDIDSCLKKPLSKSQKAKSQKPDSSKSASHTEPHKGESHNKESCKEESHKKDCPHLPGTLLRISIPEGTVINLFNLIELTSPSGVCLIARVPFLDEHSPHLTGLADCIRQAGGSVDVEKES